MSDEVLGFASSLISPPSYAVNCILHSAYALIIIYCKKDGSEFKCQHPGHTPPPNTQFIHSTALNISIRQNVLTRYLSTSLYAGVSFYIHNDIIEITTNALAIYLA